MILFITSLFSFGDLGGARTLGPLIKSQLLFKASKAVAFDATS